MASVKVDYSEIEKYARHGGAYDRGRADSWYSRPYRPHYFKGGSYSSDEVNVLNTEELAAYEQGYKDNEAEGGHKQWD